jgi:predicted DNA-binding helix-hairpin-helix protein
MLLRIPGVGVKSAYRIMQARKYATLDFDDLKRLRVALKRAVHFITCKGKFLGGKNDTVIKNLLIGAENFGTAKQLTMLTVMAKRLFPHSRVNYENIYDRL